MFTLEREIVQLLPPEQAAPLIAQERREVVSVFTEVRVLAWLGVMLTMTGVGIVISRNIDRIGPITLAAAIGIASAACYAYFMWRRASARMLDDYVLLLGALLLSADAGYIEHQFHLLGPEWPRHFLLLAVLHGVTAYLFGSRTLLALSIAALASWFGFERNLENLFFGGSVIENAIRAFSCAGVVVLWRVFNRHRDFDRVLEHSIANLGLYGGLILLFDDQTLVLGTMIVVVLAALTIAFGLRKRAESFVIYAYVYAVIAIDALVIDRLSGEKVSLLYLVLSTVAAIAGLFVLHARFRKAVE